MRNFRFMAAVLTGLLSIVSLNMGMAHADKKKPHPQPSESISLNFTKVVVTYQLEGPAGPTVEVDGQLHLVSQTFIGDDGAPVAFTLHGNVAETSALSTDGEQAFRVVGAQGGVQPSALSSVRHRSGHFCSASYGRAGAKRASCLRSA